MSSTTTKPSEASKTDQPAQQESEQRQPQPQLGALEEDDEFEEFPVQDWDDSETNLGHMNDGKVDADKLWEDNWDDDDVEDEFSMQLRKELAKTGKNPTSATASGDAMQH